MERKATQENKNLSEELKQVIHVARAQVNKAGGGMPNFPLATECDIQARTWTFKSTLLTNLTYLEILIIYSLCHLRHFSSVTSYHS